MTHVHLSADSDFWTGASTCALLAAKQTGVDSVVVTSGDDEIVRRFDSAGVKTVRCPMGGLFASLNLSRVLRRLPGSEFMIHVHSPQVRVKVEGALRLVGRKEPIILEPESPLPEIPAVEVDPPSGDAEPLLMWLGNITENCGLQQLIEEMGRAVNRAWRIKIVGHGKAKTVSPLLKRVKALDIADRVDWRGYSANPFEEMNGVSAGIVTHADGNNCIVAREFMAASVPVYTNFYESIDNQRP